MNGKKRVYLAGNISSDARTYEWRLRATELLKDRYTILNPALNKFNQELLKKAEDNPDAFFKRAIKKSQRILIVKDHQLVASSDIVLLNLSIVTPEKPPIGTIFEIDWTWILRIPLIAVVADNVYCKHPFLTSAFSATAETVEEACEIIRDFFEE